VAVVVMTSPRIIKSLIANREGAARRAEEEAARHRQVADEHRQAADNLREKLREQEGVGGDDD